MKKIIQLFLFSLIIIISIFFYRSYFTQKDITKIDKLNIDEKVLSESKNNLIQNLEYNVILNDNSEYLITADESEILYKNDVELVSMKNVIAKFFDVDNSLLVITSNKAVFNNSIYDTEFRENVEVKYLDHFIQSDKLDLNISKNIVIIYDNVIYEGIKGEIFTDNIIINLITKDVEIFMNNSQKKVTVTTK